MKYRATVAAMAFASTLSVVAKGIGADGETGASADTGSTLVLACDPENDLYKSLVAGGEKPRRFDSTKEAVDAATAKSSVLILAVGYPKERTAIDPQILAEAERKELRLYIEYPAAIPGVELDAPRGVRWERAVVASDAPNIGLPRLHILAMHDCQILPTEVDRPSLVMAQVAGFDTAVFGLPKVSYPILFQTTNSTWIAATRLSNFVTARYAPSADWLTLWTHLLGLLDPRGAPHHLVAKPLVRPAFGKEEPLPSDAEELALIHCANWYRNSRLLIAAERQANLHELLRMYLFTAGLTTGTARHVSR